MPKLEPKVAQREIEQGILWPVYWIYGGEPMKARELVRRIKTQVLGENTGFSSTFQEEVLSGADVSIAEVRDSVQSLSLGGGTRLVLVRDAHLISEVEEVADLLGPPAKKEDLPYVCVFLSKDLDGRKKSSKLLLEKAAVIPCEEVAENDREPWIEFLAKRSNVILSREAVTRLATLDPWSLDTIQNELNKFLAASLDFSAGASASAQSWDPEQVLGWGVGSEVEAFCDAFFTKNRNRALKIVEEFAESPDQALPLVGLLAWNLRHVLQLAIEQQTGSRALKLNPYLAQKLSGWAKSWSVPALLKAQEGLAELDYGVKQTPKTGLGLWTSWVLQSLPQ